MIKNYLKIAWRNLLRNKSYAAINIVGLGIGIAACLLIFLVIRFETSFDNFHQKRDHIYRVVSFGPTPAGIRYITGVPFPTGEGLRMDYPQLEVTSIFKNSAAISVLNNNGQPLKKFNEENVYFTDPQFFSLFDFEWLAGDKNTALKEPNTVVLTADAASKYFGNWQNALGKVIKYDNKINLKVSGILKNVPPNTDFKLYAVVSYATLKNTNLNSNLQDWVSNFSDHYCFINLPANISETGFNKDLTAFVKKHKPAEYVKEGMMLLPLTQMHYDTRFNVYSGHTFSRELINALSLIGIFLLIIACVNFINLATAQAVNRSREIGVRKVLGGNRPQIIAQYLCETFIINLLAIAVAVGIAQLALPFLNNLLQIELSTTVLTSKAAVLFLTTVVIGTTLLSGFYPAIIISGFNPVAALKNKMARVSTSGISLRRGLVVLQFSIAQVLVIGTLVVVSQMNYFKTYDLGFNKNAVINVPIPTDKISHSKLNALKNTLMAKKGIKEVSFSFSSPSADGNWNSDFWFNNSPKKTDFEANLKWADAAYFKLYGLKFIAGHAYEQTDSIRGYVVNETFLKNVGITKPEDAIGKPIGLWDNKNNTKPIIGVVKDFNVASLSKQIPAVILAPWKDVYQTINIKLQPTGVEQSLAAIEKLWNDTFPEYVYEYHFLDNTIAKFYERETQLSELYKIFAGIAIFISCLGLYGMVSFMAVQRTKEVGIRKTLGASVGHIIYLFSKEFTLLVIVAFTISAPVGWYFMHKWLEGFAYKIRLGPGIFVLSVTISIIIAWITVGYKAVRAAVANPVKSLRSE